MNTSNVLATFPSSTTAATYAVTKAADHSVYCTCPAWKFQRVPVALRTCKHLKSFFASQLAKKEPSVAKPVAAQALREHGSKVELRQFAAKAHEAMSKGGEAGVTAARQVLAAHEAMPSTLLGEARVCLSLAAVLGA